MKTPEHTMEADGRLLNQTPISTGMDATRISVSIVGNVRICFSGLVGKSAPLSILCLSALANILAVLSRGAERFWHALVICAGTAVLPVVELPAGCSQLVDRSDGAIVPTRECRRTQAGQAVLARAAPTLE